MTNEEFAYRLQECRRQALIEAAKIAKAQRRFAMACTIVGLAFPDAPMAEIRQRVSAL